MLFLLSVTGAPFVNSARAYAFLGVIWGLWHAPLVIVGFAFPGYPVLGVLLFIVFTTIVGVIFNEITLQ